MDKKNSKSLKWDGKSHGGYWGNRCFALLLRLGLWPAYALLVFVAGYFATFRVELSKGSKIYLERVFGKRISKFSPEIYKHFFSFGICILDKVSYFSKSGKIKCEDRCVEKIKELLKAKKGVIALTSHIGGWEIAGGELFKYGVKVGLVGMKVEGDVISEISESSRELPKPEIIGETSDSGAIISAYAALRRGEIVAMHGDRFAGGRSVEVDFFGGRVKLPLAPYILSAKSGAPIVQTLCFRKKLFLYEISAFDEVFVENLPPADLQKAAKKHAQKFMSNLESSLKKYPYQWFNFYEFWDK